MKKTEEGKALAIMVAGNAVLVTFRAHSVHINNEEPLKRLLEAGENGIDVLVSRLKETYKALYARDLDIDTNSLIVEIWGHVFCGNLADVLADKVPLTLLNKITDKVIAYCKVIDCGEPGYDGNRLFWDMLAPFKESIVGGKPGNESNDQQQ